MGGPGQFGPRGGAGHVQCDRPLRHVVGPRPGCETPGRRPWDHVCPRVRRAPSRGRCCPSPEAARLRAATRGRGRPGARGRPPRWPAHHDSRHLPPPWVAVSGMSSRGTDPGRYQKTEQSRRHPRPPVPRLGFRSPGASLSRLLVRAGLSGHGRSGRVFTTARERSGVGSVGACGSLATASGAEGPSAPTEQSPTGPTRPRASRLSRPNVVRTHCQGSLFQSSHGPDGDQAVLWELH